MDYAKESLRLHYEWKGKLEVTPRATVNNKEELSLAYTPGVAQPCLEIQKDISKSYELSAPKRACPLWKASACCSKPSAASTPFRSA